jgi:hypothetical protein
MSIVGVLVMTTSLGQGQSTSILRCQQTSNSQMSEPVAADRALPWPAANC